MVGDPYDFASAARRHLPVGMIGVHFEVKIKDVLQEFVTDALKVVFKGVEEMGGEGGRRNGVIGR